MGKWEVRMDGGPIYIRGNSRFSTLPFPGTQLSCCSFRRMTLISSRGHHIVHHLISSHHSAPIALGSPPQAHSVNAAL